MLKSLKCYTCKELFLREQLVNYAAPGSNVSHNYCPKCLQEKQSRDSFSLKVCQIFGIKTPGPRIWTERKRLMGKYGYTDQVLIDTLEYIYKVEGKRKLAESLYLIDPLMVERMMDYKKSMENKNIGLVAAANVEMKEHIVPMKENKEPKKRTLNIDDFLD